MSRVRRPLFNLLRTLLVLLLLLPLVLALRSQWYEVRATLESVNWLQAACGLMVALAAQPLMGLISWFVLLSLGYAKPFSQVLWLYFTSQLAKYLPGGIWAFPGRVVAYQVSGVDRLASIVALVREVAALYLGAAAVGLLGLASGPSAGEQARWIAAAGVLACSAAVLLTQIPAFWRLTARWRWLQRSDLSVANLEKARSGLRWMLTALPASLSFWLLIGLGCWILARSASPQAAQMPWLHAAGMFALAWCAGFVIVIAPAGIGVREATLTLLLSSYLPLSEAVAIALLARLWWTMAEAPFILFALLWVSRQAELRRLAIPSSPDPTRG